MIKKYTLKRALALILAVTSMTLFVSPDIALALPSGYTVESGDVTFDTSQADTLIISASDHAIINFDAFSIAQNESVRFLQPSSSASVLGRVTGSSSSEIFGSLFSNGQFVLVNPNGIHFGPTANIQTASLIASTLNIQSAMYLSRQMDFEKNPGSALGSIVNEGSISGMQGGHVVFLAESILNKGDINVPAGTIVFGVGEQSKLSFGADGSVSIVVEQGLADKLQSEASIQNQGTVSADGGHIILTAKTLNQTLDSLVNNTGVVRANKFLEKDGVVELVASGEIDNTGTIQTDTGSVDIQAAGAVKSSGTLTAANFTESGAAFSLGGTYSVGMGQVTNLDGAVTLNTGNFTGTTSDTGNIIVNNNAVITLTGAATFTADSDKDGVGAFTMNPGSSVTGAFAFIVNSSETATLRDVSTASIAVRDINTIGGNILLNGNLTATNSLVLQANNNLTVDDSGVARTLSGTGLTLTADADHDGFGSLSRLGANGVTLNASATGTLLLQSSTDLTTSSWLTGSTFKILNVYTRGSANITIDQDFDKSATASSELDFYSNGNLTVDATAGPRSLKVGSAGVISLEANVESGTTGALSKAGANGVTLDATTSGTLNLYSGANLTTSTWLTGANFEILNIDLNDDDAGMTIDQNLDESAIAGSQMFFYGNGNLTIDATAGARTLKVGTGGYLLLHADNDGDGVGALSKSGANGVTLNANASGGSLYLSSSSDLTTSQFLNGAVFQYLNVSTYGNGNITVDQNFDESAIAGSVLVFNSYGNLTIDATAASRTLKVGTGGTLTLNADGDADGVGALSKSGANSLTLDATASGTMGLQSASDLTTSSWLTGANFQTLNVTTTGTANLTIDQSFDKSAVDSSQLNFQSNGNLTIDATAAARTLETGTNGVLLLLADKDANGSGTLSKTGANSLTLDATTTGVLELQSASDLTTSSWLTGSNFMQLDMITTGSANLTIDQNFDESAVGSSSLIFYSYGNLTIDATAAPRTLKVNAELDLLADKDGNGAGALSKSGANGLTLDATTSGTLSLESASSLTTSAWLSGVNFGSLSVATKGDANSLTIDQSFDVSTHPLGSLEFSSDGNLIVDTTAASRTFKTGGIFSGLTFAADADADGTGSLSKAGANSITLTGNAAAFLGLQSAGDLTTSTWLTGAGFKTLSVITTGSGNITVDQSFDKSAVNGSSLSFSANGNLTIDATAAARTLKSKGQLSLLADADKNGAGTLSKSGANSLTLSSLTAEIDLESASSLTTSTWLSGATFGSLGVTVNGNNNLTIDQSFDESATSSSELGFYAGGNVTIDATAAARILKTGGGALSLQADYNNDGIGTLSKSGANSLTLGVLSTGTINLQTAGDLTTSTWLGSAVFRNFNAYASGNLTVDTSMGGATSLGSSVILKADTDADGSGSLTFGAVNIGTRRDGSLILQGANSFTTSAVFSKIAPLNSSLSLISTAGTIDIDQALTVSGQQSTLTLRAAGNITSEQAIKGTNGAGAFTLTSTGGSITTDAALSDIGNITLTAKSGIAQNANISTTAGALALNADSNADGTGAFTMAGGTSLTAPTWKALSLTAGGTSTLQTLSGSNLTLTGAASGAVFNANQNISISGNLSLANANTVLNLSGQNLTLGSSGVFTNFGNFEWNGSETLTNFTNDTAEGTITYLGTAGPYTIKDYGSADYYNLTINGSGATFNNANPLKVNGTFSLNAGTFAQGTSTMNIAGDATIASGATFTKSSNASALTFDGTGNLIDNNATKQDLGTVTIGGTTTTRALGSAVKMDALTINSGDTFNLAGNNFSFNAAAAVANSGTFRLQGDETLTNVNNLGTAAGTVEYTGNGDSSPNSYTIKDFGATDYYDLKINSTDGTTDTFTLGNNLVVADNLTIANGTFTAGANNMNLGRYIQSGGTFNAPSGNLTIQSQPSDTKISISGGTFNPNNGTVIINMNHFDYTADVNNTLSLNNLTITTDGGGIRRFDVTAGDTIVVNGALTLTDGQIGGAGTVEALGSVTHAATFDGGTGNLLIDGNATRTISLSAGGGLPNVTLNDANTTIIANSSGTIAMGDLTLQAGTFTGGAGDMSMTRLFQSGGAFTAPSGTLTISSILSDTKLSITGGTFNNNTGTLKFFLNHFDYGVTLTGNPVFYNVTEDVDGYQNLRSLDVAGGSVLVSTGTLQLLGGNITGSWQPQGNVIIGALSGFGAAGGQGQPGSASLTFSGSANQLFTNNGGNNSAGTVTINKTAGTVTLGSDLMLNSSGQDFAITQGALDLAGHNLTVNDQFTLGASGTLKLFGTETLNKAPTISAGGTVDYDGTGASYTLKNYSYSNLTLDGGASTVFSMPGNLSGINILLINTGTLSLSGSNISASTLSNNSKLQLNGSETVGFTTMDTDSGTVEYVGAGTYNSLAAGNNYYHLKFNGSGSWTANANLDVSGNLTLANGTFTAPAGNLNLAGNFDHQAGGVFAADGGTFILDGIGQQISGATTFFNLSKTVGSADTLTFGTGVANQTTVTGTLTLRGAANNLLSLRSAADGTEWKIDSQGTNAVSFVDVKDSNNLNAAFILPTSSLDRGNNQHWFAAAAPSSNASAADPVVANGIEAIQRIPVSPETFQTSQTFHDFTSFRFQNFNLQDLLPASLASLAQEAHAAQDRDKDPKVL